jgi:hypothetical protein
MKHVDVLMVVVERRDHRAQRKQRQQRCEREQRRRQPKDREVEGEGAEHERDRQPISGITKHVAARRRNVTHSQVCTWIR